jgi:hypothetical protein
MQTVWGETESFQFSIDYRYRTGTTTKTDPILTAPPARTAQNGSELVYVLNLVHSGFRRATYIVTVDIIFLMISLENF